MGPDAAVAQVRLAVRAALQGIENQLIFVACSGGADSLALAAATAFETRGGAPAGLVTIDHQLQPGSAEQARRVAQIGYDLGFDPVLVLPVEVTPGSGLEADARTARYRALDAAAQAHEAKILLGHTLDDQAETVLLGLGRGSGPRSIAGMRAERGCYLRPLLGIRRTTTLQACQALGLVPWQDPHNDDSSFQRVRLRRLLPQLDEALQGGVPEALARTAALLQDDLDALDLLAERLLPARTPNGPDGAVSPDGVDKSDGIDSIEVAALAEQPRALRTRMIRRWASAHTPPLNAGHIAAVDALVTNWHGQGPIDLPGAFCVARRSGRLVLVAPHTIHPPSRDI